MMDTRSRPAWFTVVGVSILGIMACNVSAAAPTVTAAPLDPSPSPTPIVIVVTATQQETPTFEPTETSEPTLTPTDTPVPQPRKPKAKSSNADGDCGSGGLGPEGNFDCKVVISDGLPVQFKVLKDGNEIGKQDGVQGVEFTVRQNGDVIYDHTEQNAAYCLFGGDEPCNSWTIEDNVYKWESGGAVVEARKYDVQIQADVDDGQGTTTMNWSARITITFP